MSMDQERREHQRYPLRLKVRLHRAHEALDAEIVNASTGGCLLMMPTPLAAGDALEASIPQLQVPRTTMHVLRTQREGAGYLVAVCFNQPKPEDQVISRYSESVSAPAPAWRH